MASLVSVLTRKAVSFSWSVESHGYGRSSIEERRAEQGRGPGLAGPVGDPAAPGNPFITAGRLCGRRFGKSPASCDEAASRTGVEVVRPIVVRPLAMQREAGQDVKG